MVTLHAIVDALPEAGSDLGDALLLAAIGAVAGLLIVAVGQLVVFRVWRSTVAQISRTQNRLPRLAVGAAFGAFVTVAVGAPAGEPATAGLRRVLVLLLIAALTWYAVGLLYAVEQAAVESWDTDHADNLLARRRRTQYLVLRRAGTVIVVAIGVAAALLTFPSARSVGQSLLASAGVLGIIVGVAAQGVLKNLVAGIQIALAQPIRLGDAVLVDGEWGTIEDITLTTVVVAVWDRRRLVHPTSWFTEQPFQNWTRSSAQLLGQVTLVLDHRVDVPALREAAEQIITSHPLFDGDSWVLQVTEASAEGVTVRALMTAVDAPTSWDLRCAVREELIAWLVEHDPDALPHRRVLLSDDQDALVPADVLDDTEAAAAG